MMDRIVSIHDCAQAHCAQHELWPDTTMPMGNYQLDVDPQRDDDASPMSTYRCMLRPTWMLISALQHKSKYKSNSISNFFEKKINFFFGSHAVVLVKTFPLTYQLLM